MNVFELGFVAVPVVGAIAFAQKGHAWSGIGGAIGGLVGAVAGIVVWTALLLALAGVFNLIAGASFRHRDKSSG